jgi:hypothetical protein
MMKKENLATATVEGDDLFWFKERTHRHVGLEQCHEAEGHVQTTEQGVAVQMPVSMVSEGKGIRASRPRGEQGMRRRLCLIDSGLGCC